MPDIENLKEVYYCEYCNTCKHKDESNPDPELSVNDICHECLNEPSRQYSHKPIKYEKK